jgi:protein-S-isoprenylcysteine O-methyltransferase Ste14
VTAAANVRVSRPERIVTRGPYARSRNPMYVAWTALYLGVTFLVGSLWLLILLPAVLLATHLTVLSEERRLRHRFGEDYLRYASSVRRYL